MKKMGLIGACALWAGCSSSAGEGTVAFTTWGEEYIEQQIPASELADGWTIEFDKFLVAISDIEVAADGEVGFEDTTQRVFDMTQAGKKAVTQATLEARVWNQVSYRIGPAGEGAALDASATQADLELMQQGKLSVYVAGRATKGAESKTFAWGFGEDTTYANCRGEVSGAEQAGAVVTEGGTDTIELTIHGDHFFYDDLASADAALRFDNMARADADADGVITLEELGAVDRADLTGGTYQVGGFSDVFTYRDFVTKLSRTLGHFRGEGECESS